jgi:hypothetical protein
MQAVAAELSGFAGKPPPLFELRRIPLLFREKSSNTVCFDSFIFKTRS